MELRIATLDELLDAETDARIAARRATRQGEVLRTILSLFVERGGPVAREAIVAALPDRAPEAVRADIDALAQADLVVLADGAVEIAYPFSTLPTAFVVRWPDGRERYACCAIDALGMAPMLGHPVHVSSRCHHCGDPLELTVDVAGPGAEARDLLVWIGTHPEDERRLADSL